MDGIIEVMPLFVKELVAGGMAGGVAKTVVAPLERVKILFQVQLVLPLYDPEFVKLILRYFAHKLSNCYLIQYVIV